LRNWLIARRLAFVREQIHSSDELPRGALQSPFGFDETMRRVVRVKPERKATTGKPKPKKKA